MTYEYCIVSLDKVYNPLLEIMVSTDKSVTARNGTEIISEGDTYLEVFNKLGNEGWHLVASTEKDYSIFYFERIIKSG